MGVERFERLIYFLRIGLRRRCAHLRIEETGKRALPGDSSPSPAIRTEPSGDWRFGLRDSLSKVTVDSLESMLQRYPGTVVLVSHDRSLLDGVCGSFLVMQDASGRILTVTPFSKAQEHGETMVKKHQLAAARVLCAKIGGCIEFQFLGNKVH